MDIAEIRKKAKSKGKSDELVAEAVNPQAADPGF